MLRAFSTAVLAAALAALEVQGHAYMSNPMARAVVVGGHPMSNCPQCDGAVNGNCRDGGRVGPIQATWIEGQEVEIEITLTGFPHAWTFMKGTN
jgi:hypothetical protein